jgi:crotonobetainyl-CoA:carnitine CoA-transferase CaiB-like acyl-CoA transferase
MPLPLEGVRVLDCSRVLAGPLCTMILADLGADVIKLEDPRQGDETRGWGPPFVDGYSAYYLCANRGKKSLAVDLKTPEGLAIVRRLAQTADVVIENFRAGKADELGIGYKALTEDNPGLVYCSITGFGQTGPYRDLPGYDFIIQAMSGLMSITGEPDGRPMKVGVAVADVFTGLYAAVAILAALRAREKTGRGQHIDLALYDAQLAALVNVASNALNGGVTPRRMGNEHPNIVPYQSFPAADGEIAVAVGNDRQFRRLCEALGCPELADDARFAHNPDRVRHREALVRLLSERFQTEPVSLWMERLTQAEIPCGPIQTVDRAFADPHVAARGMVWELLLPTGAVARVPGNPIHFSDTPLAPRGAPPALGEHTDEVLEALGIDSATRARLRETGVIR